MKIPYVKDWSSLCKTNSNPLSAIRLSSDWLRFKDFCHFEETVNELDQKGDAFIREFEFKNNLFSMRQLNESIEEIEIGDEDEDPDDRIVDYEPLAAVLNSNGIVEIGNTIYKIDIGLNQLIMIPSKDANLIYNSRELTNNGNALSIKLDSADIDLTDNCLKIENEGSFDQRGLRCNGCNGANVKGDPYPEYKTSEGVYRFKMKASYRNFGIYKRLQLKVKHQFKAYNGSSYLWKLNEAPYLYFFAEATYTRRCRDSFFKRPDLLLANKKKHKHNIYSGVKKLSAFNVKYIFLGGWGKDSQWHRVHLLDLTC